MPLRHVPLAALCVFAACPSSSAPVTPDDTTPPPGPVVPTTVPPAVATSPPAEPVAVAPIPALDPILASKQAADANNAFALALYDQLRAGDGNRFFSPVSMSIALTMTTAGAAGTTEAELRTALHLPERGADEAFGALQAAVVAERGAGNVVRLVNRLWAQKSYELLESFLDETQRSYGAGVERVDFGDTERARGVINGWVSGQTDAKVPELIGSGVLTADTRLVLTNAVYFKGIWADAFDLRASYEAPFAVMGGKPVKTTFMTRKGRYGYAEDEQVQVLSLPYKDAGLSLVVVLPRAADGLAGVEAALGGKLAGWLEALDTTKVEVHVPRFELRAKAAMKAPLEALGVREAFTRAADFSRMTGDDDLYISAVVHEAYVLVDEAGTEAAAATAVVMVPKSGAPRPAPEFRADHPFFFALRDDRTGCLLFVGRVADPTAG